MNWLRGCRPPLTCSGRPVGGAGAHAGHKRTALAGSGENGRRLGLTDGVSFERGDALDAKRAGSPKAGPRDGVGLCRIIHDDALIRNHFSQLGDILSLDALLFSMQTRNPRSSSSRSSGTRTGKVHCGISKPVSR
jgi:hypothetical protein